MAYLGHKPAVGENNSFRILDDISSFVLTFDGSSASVVGLSDETITITENNHRFITGQRVTYSNGGGGNITGLTNGQAYFVINHSKTQIKLASSASNALAGTAVNLTGLGTGSSHTLTLAFDGVNTKFDPTFGDGMHDTLIKRAAQLVISLNGVIQQPHDTATPSTGFGVDSLGHIIFSTAPASTDIFWGHILASNTVTFDSSDNDVDTFTGNGSTTSFTLSKIPPDNRNILVTIDGVVQYPSDAANTRSYNVSENVMTFVAAPGLGTVIQVRHIGYAGVGAGGGGGVTGFYGRTGNVSLVSTDDIVANNATFSGNISAVDATFSGNVSIAQTLTYEDVTDIDAIGLITARSGIKDQTLTASRVVYVDSDKTLTDSSTLTYGGNGVLNLMGASGNTQLALFRTNTNTTGTAGIVGFYASDNHVIASMYALGDGNNEGAHLVFNTTGAASGTNPYSDVDERLRIASNGRVGILTVTPEARLDVYDTSGLGILSRSAATQATDTNKALKVRNNSTTDTFNVSYKGQGYFAGKVGIGTEIPAEKLSVEDSSPAILINATSATGESKLQFGRLGNTNVGEIKYEHSNNAFTFRTNDGADRLRIDSSGRLLMNGAVSGNAFSGGDDIIIGSTSARSGITLVSSTSNDGGLYFSKGTSSNSDHVKGQIVYQHDGDGGYLRLYTNATERLRITSTGRLAILNNNEDIDMDSSSNGQFQIDGNGYTGAITLNDEAMFLYHNSSSRYIGIGVNETEVGRFSTGGYEQRFSNTSTYSSTTGSRKGIYVFNSGATTNCYASLELGANNSNGHFGSTILNSIATADTTFSNHFAIQLRHGGSYYERLRISSGGQVFVGSNTGWNESTALISMATDSSAGANMLSDTSAIYNHNNPAFIHVQNRYNTGTGQEAGIIFHSRSSYNGSWAIYGKRTSSNYLSDLIFRNRTGSSASAERLRITSGGNVGINDASPSYALNVIGDNTASNGIGMLKGIIGVQNDTTAFGSSPTAGISFQTKYRTGPDVPLDVAAIWGGKENTTNGDKDGYMGFATREEGGSGTQERMRITSAGLLGLNRTPVYSGLFGGSQKGMHIGGSTAPFLRITSDTSNQGDLVLHAGNSGADISMANMTAGGDIVFWSKPTGGSMTERMRVQDNGEFQLKPPGNAPCDVAFKLNNNNDSRIKFYDSGGTYRGGFGFTEYANSTDFPNYHDSFYWITHNGTSTRAAMRLNNKGVLVRPYHPAFHWRKDNGQTYDTTFTTIGFGDKIFDRGNDIQGSDLVGSSTFTAPVTGIYFFHADVNVVAYSGKYFYLAFYLNGNQYSRSMFNYEQQRKNHEIAMIIEMQQGDTVTARAKTNSGTITGDNDGKFFGYLIG